MRNSSMCSTCLGFLLLKLIKFLHIDMRTLTKSFESFEEYLTKENQLLVVYVPIQGEVE